MAVTSYRARAFSSSTFTLSPLSPSIVILYLRFGAQVLQDNFVAELSTHYQNYILLMGVAGFRDAPCGGVSVQVCACEEGAGPGTTAPGGLACLHPV